jgi:hypothetical protein
MRGRNRSNKRGKPHAVPDEDGPQGEALIAKQRDCITAIPKLVCTEAFAVPFADDVDKASITDVLTCEP